MALTRESRRTVFRQIAQQSYVDWPTYESSPLFDRTSLPGLESDVRLVAETWFQHDDHEGVDQFVRALPLAYVQFNTHGRYAGSTSYEMETLFRLFLLKECHGWDHETALVEYLTQHPDLRDRLDLESVPDQSTLWRSWHHRFTADLQDAVETAARAILIKAQNAGVTVPRKLERQSRRYDTEDTESDPSDQTQSITSKAAQSCLMAVNQIERQWGHLTEYGYRWEIESGYRSIKRFMATTTSKDFGLRFFYFAFACLLYSIWRAVDLLVQVELTGEYERSSIVTADNTLTLLKKETGIG